MKGTLRIITVVVLLAGFILVTFFSIFSSQHAKKVVAQNNSTQEVNTAFQSKSTNLRLQLNVLLKEHTVLGAIMLTSLYKGEDTTRLQQLMDTNTDQLAEIIGNVYGPTMKSQFITLWQQHMQEYNNYTIAKKNNNTAQMNTAKTDLQTIENNLGNSFSNVSKHLSAATVTSLMKEHVTDTIAVVDETAEGDATEKADAIKKGYDQADQFADTLVKGMIQDKPEMFQ